MKSCLNPSIHSSKVRSWLRLPLRLSLLGGKPFVGNTRARLCDPSLSYATLPSFLFLLFTPTPWSPRSPGPLLIQTLEQKAGPCNLLIKSVSIHQEIFVWTFLDCCGLLDRRDSLPLWYLSSLDFQFDVVNFR